MGKVKSAWQEERELNRALGWSDVTTNEATQTRWLKKSKDEWNLWDNDDRGDGLITDTDLGALMARWEEL